MKHNRLFSRHNFWGLLIAVVLAAVTGFQAIQFSQDDLLRQHARRGAVMNAMALASLVGNVVENTANKQQAVDGINTIIDEWAIRKLALDSIRVVQGRELLASTVPEDEKVAGPAPRRLISDEKELFDVGQELRRNVQINTQEDGVRKPQDIVKYMPGGLVSIASPYFVNGKVKGYVEANIYLNIKEDTTDYTSSILLVIAPLILFVILSISPFIPAKDNNADTVIFVAKPFLIASGLLLASLAVFFNVTVDDYSVKRTSWEERLHEEYQSQTSQVGDIFTQLQLEDTYSLNTNRTYSLARLYVASRGDEYDSSENSFNKLDNMTIEAIKQVEAEETGQITGLLYTFSTIAFIVMVTWGSGLAARVWRTIVTYRAAYAYITPAMVGMLLLVFFPFGYGILLSFTKQGLYTANESLWDILVWFDNYWDIMKLWTVDETGKHVWALVSTGQEGQVLWNYNSFYWTLFMTICWTVFNVVIGVTFGLILALALNTKGLALRPVYRVLLILPWAIPNYITALIWKGMFHQQFGAINQVIQMFGGEPLAWFDSTFTSFLTGLATNGWLSFPFMMVICLGALQSIDTSMYEAARVEGATRWQQFKYITLPSLKPTLIPAIILSVVWTFNMFNVIYLVSGGDPAGSTEILITKAYKIAFEEYRYGYAAAYSTVIFGILVLYGMFQNKVSKAAEG